MHDFAPALPKHPGCHSSCYLPPANRPHDRISRPSGRGGGGGPFEDERPAPPPPSARRMLGERQQGRNPGGIHEQPAFHPDFVHHRHRYRLALRREDLRRDGQAHRAQKHPVAGREQPPRSGVEKLAGNALNPSRERPGTTQKTWVVSLSLAFSCRPGSILSMRASSWLDPSSLAHLAAPSRRSSPGGCYGWPGQLRGHDLAQPELSRSTPRPRRPCLLGRVLFARIGLRSPELFFADNSLLDASKRF